MGYIVTARLLLDVASETEAADGANECLRVIQRDFTPSSCLIDYALDSFTPQEIAPDYQEGDAFLMIERAKRWRKALELAAESLTPPINTEERNALAEILAALQETKP